jgi:hypothetical protein
MLHFRTPLNSRSFSGYPLDELKSGLQKYLRRDEIGKMVWCMEELFLFGVLGKTDSERKTGNAILSNLINRLIVMMDEEMLFIEVERYLLMREYLEKFENGGRKEVRYLRLLCEILNEGKKCRRNSYGRSYWCHRLQNEVVEEKSDKEYFENFVECFEAGKEEWAIWMFRILNGGKCDGKKRFRRSENIYMIWEYLFHLEKVKKDENLKRVLEYKLKEFFKKDRKERFIFLYSCVDLCMYFDGDWKDIRGEYDLSLKVLDEVYRYDEMDLEKREKIELDDYVVDVHTSRGRKMGRNKKEFKEVGCLVVNENEEFLREEWKDFYVNFTGKNKMDGKKKELKEKEKKSGEKKKELKEKKKKIGEKKKKENMNFDFVENKELLEIDENEIKLCSDVVCGNKVVCFEYDGKIYKEGRKSMNYNLDYYVFDRCKELFGLNCIGMELRLGKFRIVKKDKSVLSYKDNWMVEETEEEVVYCVMNKIGNCEMLIEKKEEVVKNAGWLKEYCRIGMVRGIFRVSDFNMRNVLMDGNGELVSIDENDILGKRKDVFGMKNRAVLKELKKNENLLVELLQEIWEVDFETVEEIVKKFGFDGEKIRENWKKLEEDVRKELNF